MDAPKHECQIYVLFDEKGNVNYVGRTARPINLRMNEHRQALGFRPKFRIIDRCSTDCRTIEKHWIDYYRNRGFKLRNISHGQGPHFLAESSRLKLGMAFIGRPVTWGHKIAATQKGKAKNWSAEGIERQKATRFKKGVPRAQQPVFQTKARPMKRTEAKRIFESLSSAEQQELLNNRTQEPKPRTPEELAEAKRLKSERMSASQRARWASYTPGRRQEVCQAFKNADRDLEQMAETGRAGAKKQWDALRADPDRCSEFIRRRASAQAQKKRQLPNDS